MLNRFFDNIVSTMPQLMLDILFDQITVVFLVSVVFYYSIITHLFEMIFAFVSIGNRNLRHYEIIWWI